MDHLLAIGTFVRIAETGSLSAAARAAGRSLPAVSRSLIQLEKHLGGRLMLRTKRRTHLTEAGTRYLERCKRLLAELEEASYAGEVTTADQAVEYARRLRENPAQT